MFILRMMQDFCMDLGGLAVLKKSVSNLNLNVSISIIRVSDVKKRKTIRKMNKFGSWDSLLFFLYQHVLLLSMAVPFS